MHESDPSNRGGKSNNKREGRKKGREKRGKGRENKGNDDEGKHLDTVRDGRE